MENSTQQIEKSERIMSVVFGAAMLYHEFKKDESSSKIKLALATYLVYKGLSGHCPISEKLGLTPFRF